MGQKARNKFPTFKPNSQRTHTATLDIESYLAEWKEVWTKAKADGTLTKDTFKSFTDKHGIFVVDGLKLKPSTTARRPGPGLSGAEDFAQNKRLWRGEILTYMFGGTPKGSKAFGEGWMTYAEDMYGNQIPGEIMDAHHFYGNAEAAPWVDDIIDRWFSEDPKLKQEAREMIEAGRAYFEDSDLFLGDVEENYRMFTRPQHTGDFADPRQSMHGVQSPDFDYGTDITGPQGRSPFYYENLPSYTTHPDVDVDKSVFLSRPKGVMGQDPVKFIQSRPWSKEYSLSFVEDQIIDGKVKKVKRKTPVPRDNAQSRWHTFEDHIRQSLGLRNELAEDVYKNPALRTRRELGLEIDIDAETKFKKFGGKLGKADALTNFGVGVATGNYLQALGGGAGLVLADEKTQTKIAKVFAKRASKSALKLIPGVDIALSGAEAFGYLTEGKFDQAGIAALSGAVGWVPVIGDAAAASLDLTNTGIDVLRMDVGNKKKKADVDLDYRTKNTWNSIYRQIGDAAKYY